MNNLTFAHVTVLLEEAVELLKVKENGIYVDCTLGGGGHSNRISQKLTDSGRLIAFDQDIMAINNGQNLFAHKKNIILIHNNFAHVQQELMKLGINQVDGFLYDIGVSSPQLDIKERGFSYQQKAFLDMRMNTDDEITAHHVVNNYGQEELAKIFWDYGEEKWAKRVAQFIVEQRKNQEIDTTDDLVEIIKKAIPKGARREGPHPAKRIFQALRIYVNDELGVLQRSLEQSFQMLKPGGRLSIITFHSLEDRIVKQFIKEQTQGCTCPAQLPICVCGNKPAAKNLTRKPIIPSTEEIDSNPRARSAKLRGCEKL